jgi:hypothetical protein
MKILITNKKEHLQLPMEQDTSCKAKSLVIKKLPAFYEP